MQLIWKLMGYVLHFHVYTLHSEDIGPLWKTSSNVDIVFYLSCHWRLSHVKSIYIHM